MNTEKDYYNEHLNSIMKDIGCDSYSVFKHDKHDELNVVEFFNSKDDYNSEYGTGFIYYAGKYIYHKTLCYYDSISEMRDSVKKRYIKRYF